MQPAQDPRLVRLELAGVVLLLLAAAVPRFRDLAAPLDRAVDGMQGSLFAVGAVNYERLGIARYGGYPVFTVDLPSDPEVVPYVYPNHPPVVPLLAWASVAAFGPEGWNEAWREGEPPLGIEGALRLPFLCLHMLGLWALWWALRASDGPRTAMLALAVAAVLPIGVVCAGLVNYENACVPPLLVALGFHARWLASRRPAALAMAGLFAFLASAVTFTPVFFLPALVVQTWLALGRRRAAREALVLGSAALLPLLLHGLWVRASVPVAAEGVWTRAWLLLSPAFDGSAPLAEWTRRQLVRLSYFFGPLTVGVAAAGLVVALARLRRGGRTAEERGSRRSLVLPLAVGALLSQLGLYRHTFDGAGALDGQTNFLLNLAPAVAALAALALAALARPLARLRGGFAPLVVVVSLVAFPALSRANAIRRTWRAPAGAPGAPETPLPSTSGPAIAEVLPQGSVGLFPVGALNGPVAGFYAWRTLLGVDESRWEGVMLTVDHRIGPATPRYLLFPTDPLPGPRELVRRFRPGLVRRFGQPLASGGGWELWPPEP